VILSSSANIPAIRSRPLNRSVNNVHSTQPFNILKKWRETNQSNSAVDATERHHPFLSESIPLKTIVTERIWCHVSNDSDSSDSSQSDMRGRDVLPDQAAW
jgi:hypothetical protein